VTQANRYSRLNCSKLLLIDVLSELAKGLLNFCSGHGVQSGPKE